jgi:hypothetical protein
MPQIDFHHDLSAGLWRYEEFLHDLCEVAFVIDKYC